MLKTYKLKNGVNVVTYSIPQMRSVYLDISAKSGSMFDSSSKCGAAHFMEHMLVQGTPSLPNVEVFSEFIEGLAGSYNAMTYPDHIKFVATAPAKSASDLIRISSEVFFEPLFPKDALNKERNAVLEEIRQRIGTTGYKKYKFYSQTRYKKGHPFLQDAGGDIDTVKKINRADLINFWSKFFFTKNTYLVLVGGFKNEDVKKQIEQYFNKYDSKSDFPGFPNITNDNFSNRTVAIRLDSELKTCDIDLTWPSITGEHSWTEEAPQRLIRNILARLRRSRLFVLLRQRKGLVYGVSMGSSTYPKFGLTSIGTEAIPENIEEVIKLITQELINFTKHGPTDQELDFAKNYSINSALMQFDNPSAITGWIENDLLWEKSISTPEEYANVIKEVSKDDIMDFMKKYWDFAKLNLVIQGPIKNSKQNIDKFTKIIDQIR